MSSSDRFEANPYAPPVAAIEVYEPALEPESLYSGYAPFGRRAVAFLADGLIAAVLSWFVLAGVMVTAGLALGAAVPDMFEDDGPAGVVFALMTLLAQLATYVGYYAGMESSRWQATPGKIAMGLRVTDLYGQRITFARAVGRLAGKIPSALLFYAGFFAAAFTEKHQALHDLMAGTLVVRLR